jgi:hypothetical protein
MHLMTSLTSSELVILLDEYRFPPDRVSASFRKKWKMASMPFP